MKSLLVSVLVAAMLVGCGGGGSKKNNPEPATPDPVLPLPGGQDPGDPNDGNDDDPTSVYDRLIVPAVAIGEQVNTTDNRIIIFENYQSAAFSQYTNYKNLSNSLLVDDYNINLSGVIGEVSAVATDPLLFGISQTQSIKNLMTFSGGSVNVLTERLSSGAIGPVYNVVYDVNFSRNTRINDLREILVNHLDENVRLVYPRSYTMNNTAHSNYRLVTTFISVNGKGYMSAYLLPTSQYTAADNTYRDLITGANLAFLP